MADVAWNAEEGGEFLDEYNSNLDVRVVPFFTVRDMVDPDLFDDKVRHKDSTVRRRMTQPYGPMMTDTLLTNGLPPAGTAGDPDAPPPEPKVLVYKPLDDGEQRRGGGGGGRAAGERPDEGGAGTPVDERPGDARRALNPHDSVTQMYAEGHHRGSDGDTYASRRSRASARSARSGDDDVMRMYKDALRDQERAAEQHRAAYDDDDDDDDGDGDGDSYSARARSAAPQRAPRDADRRQLQPPRLAAPRRDMDFERMGTATLLEAGPVASAPGTRATLMNLNRRVHKQRRRLRAKRRAREEAAVGGDGDSVSDASSVLRAEEKLRDIRAELEEEERVQYITYLREAHADGLCSEPRDDASAVELRCTFEAVVCNRERIVRVNRAMMVMVALVFAVELALRLLGVPVRVRGMGVFFQRAMQSGQYDEFLERVYETTLSSYSWNGTWETVFTIGALLVGFMMVKYLGDGDEEKPAPFGPKGLMVPPELDGKRGGMNDVLDTLGGMRNITSLYSTFQNGTWSRTGRRAAPAATAFDTTRSHVQQRGGGAAAGGGGGGGGGGVRLPTAAPRAGRGAGGARAAARPVAKAGSGPVTTEPPSSDDDE